MPLVEAVLVKSTNSLFISCLFVIIIIINKVFILCNHITLT